MALTWEELNKGSSPTKTQDAWANLNAAASQNAYKQEAAAQTGVDKALYEQVRSRGVSSIDARKQLTPEKVTKKDVLKTTAKKIGSGVFQAASKAASAIKPVAAKALERAPIVAPFAQLTKALPEPVREVIPKTPTEAFKLSRGVSQLATTPVAAGLGAAFPMQGQTRAESAMNAAKESLKMAKDVAFDPNVSVDVAIDKAADMWLKNRGVGKYGGKDPDVSDYLALGTLQLFNLLGDPAFEFGLALKGAKALKEFAQFEKVGKITKPLQKGSSFVKGTEVAHEINITDDLKIKILPKNNEVVFVGYKRRFPTVVDNKLAPETQELISGIRKSTGQELMGRFEGDDLILTPKEPAVLLRAGEKQQLLNAPGKNNQEDNSFEQFIKENGLQRIEEPGTKNSFDKPQGLYTTPANVASPHVDLGGTKTIFGIKPGAKEVTVDTSGFSSNPMERGVDQMATNLVWLRNELPEVANNIRGKALPQLKVIFAKEFPKTDWERYEEKQDMIEGYAGLKAREMGIDIIRGIDNDSPEFNEVVILNKNIILTKSELEEIWKEKNRTKIKPGQPIQGEGFTMTEKADPQQVAISKEIQKYQTMLKSYAVEPTPTKLRNLKNTKATISQLIQQRDNVVVPTQAPTVSTPVGGVFSRAIKSQGAPQVATEQPVVQPTQREVMPEKAADTIAQEAPLPKEIAPEPAAVRQANAKPSKMALDIQAKAIEKGLLDSFGEIAGHNPKNIQEQSELIAKMISKDLDQVKQMIRGIEPVPSNISGTYLIKSLEDYATKTDDMSLIQDLIKSPLVADTSRFASELRMARERNPYSPIAVMRAIKKERIKRVVGESKARSGEKTQAKIKKEREKIIKDIKSNVKPIKKDAWESFIDTITC